MIISETFSDLLRDRAHWEFEIFLQLLIDGLILGILWPFLYKHIRHHLDRDRSEKLKERNDAERILYRFKTAYPSIAQWHAQLENAAKEMNREFPPGLCYFCKSPTITDSNDIERCDICGAYRIQDEWVSPDVPPEPGTTEGLKQALNVVTKNLENSRKEVCSPNRGAYDYEQ